MGSGQPATIAAVATLASASTRDVALVVAADQRVQSDIRQRVIEAMNATAFKPLAAIQQKLGRPARFAIVMKVHRSDNPEENRFYVPIASAIAHACAANGAEVMPDTMTVNDHYELLDAPASVHSGRCDGAFLIGAQLTAESAAALSSNGSPMVLVDGYCEAGPLDSVVTDNETGGRLATEHLIATGHSEIGLLGTEPNSYPSMLGRRIGYGRALADHGLPAHYIDTPYLLHDSAAVVGLRYLDAHPEVSAVFGANDVVTVALGQAARDAGYILPRDLSLVGFDDIDLASLVMPALTTMAVDKAVMGRAAFALMCHRVECREAEALTSLIVPRLVERESVAPPHD